jgi:hypothetical protein
MVTWSLDIWVNSSTDSHWAEIKSGKITYRIVGMPDRGSPKVPDHREATYATIESAVLREMIERMLFSICNDETRFHLTGAFFESNGSKSWRVSTWRWSIEELACERSPYGIGVRPNLRLASGASSHVSLHAVFDRPRSWAIRRAFRAGDVEHSGRAVRSTAGPRGTTEPARGAGRLKARAAGRPVRSRPPCWEGSELVPRWIGATDLRLDGELRPPCMFASACRPR